VGKVVVRSREKDLGVCGELERAKVTWNRADDRDASCRLSRANGGDGLVTVSRQQPQTLTSSNEQSDRSRDHIPVRTRPGGKHERAWCRRPQLAQEHIELGVEVPGEVGESAASWRDLKVPTVLDVKRYANAGGQFLDLRMKRRLGQMQLFGGFGEVGVVSKDAEGAQCVEGN
jgi:hypothetical protein